MENGLITRLARNQSIFLYVQLSSCCDVLGDFSVVVFKIKRGESLLSSSKLFKSAIDKWQEMINNISINNKYSSMMNGLKMANSDLVQSLLRGIDILIMLSENKSGMRVGEIADVIGVKSPAAHNLLRTLAARDMVEKRDFKYHLGTGVYRFSIQEGATQLREKSKACLLSLVKKYPNATYTFASFQHDGLHIWLRVSPDRPGTIQEPTENPFHNAYGNASGIAFQAFGDKASREKIWLCYPFHEYGAHLWGSYENLENHLETVREKGYATLPFEDKVRVAVAVPIYDSNGALRLVLGASASANTRDARKRESIKLIKLIEEAKDEFEN